MKYLILLSMILGSLTSFAQPSDAQIRADLKKKFPTISSVELTPGAGTIKKEFENNTWVTVYRRDVTMISKATDPKLSNVTVKDNGAVRYNLENGKYVFKKYLVGNSTATGIPEPDEKEILALVQSDVEEVFRSGVNEIIGTPTPFKIAENNKFTWHNANSVSFKVVTDLERFYNSIGDAETVMLVYQIRLYREEGGAWDRFIATKVDSECKRLSTKNYSEAERSKIKTYNMILQNTK